MAIPATFEAPLALYGGTSWGAERSRLAAICLDLIAPAIDLVFAASFGRQSAESSTAVNEWKVTGSICDTSDQLDIAASLQGDGEAFARIVERYQHNVKSRMWKFTRDGLIYDELVHDVFVEAYLSLHSYKAKAPFKHWLLRIATRVGYKYWRSRDGRREQQTFSLQAWDEVIGPDVDNVNATDAAEQIHLLLAQLAPRDRLVLTLMYLEGCSVAETAASTGWSSSMVKVQAHRARAKLRRLLEDQRS